MTELKVPTWIAVVHWIEEFRQQEDRAFSAHEIRKAIGTKATGGSRQVVHNALNRLEELGYIVKMPSGYDYRHWRVRKTWTNSQDVIYKCMMWHQLKKGGGVESA